MNRSLWLRLISFVLFWTFLSVVLSVTVFGFGSVVMMELTWAAWEGLVPPEFALFGWGVLMAPVATAAVALHPRMMFPDSTQLMELFYGVLVPVLVVLLFRMFALHELIPATALFFVVTLVGVGNVLRGLLFGFVESSNGVLAVRSVSSVAYAVLAAWWASLAMLWLLPIVPWTALALLSVLFEGLARGDWVALLLLPVFLSLFILLLSIAIVPFATFGTSLRHAKANLRASKDVWGGAVTVAAGLCAVVLPISALWLANQPQTSVIPRIEAAQSDAERRALFAEREVLRAGLLSARLASDRFLDADPDSTLLAWWWGEEYDEPSLLSPIAVAVHEGLVYPISYHPVHAGFVRESFGGVRPKDVEVASRLYADVFDASMVRGEQDALLQSRGHAWDWRAVEADLLAVGQRRIHLLEQDIRVDAHGDVGTVMIHDVWQNHTPADEEIVLHFELPETAAIHGLWMGTDPNRDEAFAFQVATRGAAQEVYERQVQRRIDPALLEMVGPRQYRLRVYPVPGAVAFDDFGSPIVGAVGEPLHVWMEVVVPVMDGRFALPVATEARNAFWDTSTTRLLQGEPVDSESWMPRAPASLATRTSHAVRVGDRWLGAVPDVAVPAQWDRVDVIVDGSASMDEHRGRIADSLESLRAARVQVDIYCVREEVLERCEDFDPAFALFWGRRTPEEHVADRARLPKGSDIWVVLTDSGSYDLVGDAEASFPDVEIPPTWMVHLDRFPTATSDWLLDRLQRSGGGVSHSVNDARAQAGDPDVADGWRFGWIDDPGTPSDVAFAPIAARRAITMLARDQQGSVEALDGLHAIAKQAEVVSPWSSMIVLVNLQQKRLLEALEKADDRFEREANDGEAFTEVHAVPEPGTWLLLGLGALVLLRKQREGEGVDDLTIDPDVDEKVSWT